MGDRVEWQERELGKSVQKAQDDDDDDDDIHMHI